MALDSTAPARALESLRRYTPSRCRANVDIPILDGQYIGTFFSFDSLSDSGEHIAIGLGPWRDVDVPLVRLHSECLTGDVFGSGRCDCGKQLIEAIERIASVGGFLLYLRQEGRGIGLYNKLDSYRLQTAGLDTYAANRALGFDDDLRDYGVGAQMLLALGRLRIRLLTNNPEKADALTAAGITIVERVRTGVHAGRHNRTYLLDKAVLAGHDIPRADLSEPLPAT